MAITSGSEVAPSLAVFESFALPLSAGELLKRTLKETSEDDCLGLAAQLAYYFFLALFPAILFLLALASFFPLGDLIDTVVRTLGPFAPPDVLKLIEDLLRRIAGTDSGGLLTIGAVGAVWSSSAALVAIVTSLNRAYDIDEGRPWWKVRLIAIGLTIALAVMVLASFTLIVAGPTLAEWAARTFGFGPGFEWTWKIVQWPLAFFMVSTAIGLVYYFAPDADQEWVWITPGAVLATALWVVASLGFKFYIARFTDYNAAYGTVGGIIILMLWLYISGLVILVGAELNAEVEHASPYGKAPGEKVPGQRKKIGLAAFRAYKERMAHSANRQAPDAKSAADEAAIRHEKATGVGPSMVTTDNARTLGEMFAELSRETRTLIQKEVELAKVELKEKAASAGRGAAFIVGGSLLAYCGLLVAAAALVLGLVAMGLPPWGAALISAVLLAAAGYLVMRLGVRALRPQQLEPRRTIETLKENARWLKSEVR